MRRHVGDLIALAAMTMGGVPAEIQAALPPADCARCKHRRPDTEGAHCRMFEEKPGTRCGQFARDEKITAPSEDEIAAQLREERLRRKRENFEKRQPKGAP